jgi:hypothetical protein
MSIHGVEKVLYDLSMSGKTRKTYVADPASFLASYNLSESETAEIMNFQVAGMLAKGVNSMLLMGYWMQLEPSHSIRNYLAALRQPAVKGEA